jgi:hypothetical protein
MRLASLLAVLASPALAYEDAPVTAYTLGSVLGSEVPCELTLDSAAVEAFVAARVDPAEIGFANHLAGIASATTAQVEAMTEAAKAAHCNAVAGSAAHYGLVK